MKGEMLIFVPGVPNVERRELSAPPDAATLQSIVGGYIEAVPFFHTFEIAGRVERCVAFVNENGKIAYRWNGVDRDPLPVNGMATRAWEAALQRCNPPASLIGPDRAMKDFLVGPCVVLIGDDSFFEEL